MLTRRVIVCLDVKGGRVVKGVRFRALRDISDAATLAADYERQGADEIVFLNIAGGLGADEGGALRRTAERLFVPLTVGGGIRSVGDVAAALRAGADKVAINSAAVSNPSLLTQAAREFGSQCVVASIDVAHEPDGSGDRWRVWTHGASRPTALDALEWAKECEDRGAGEILLTSIDRDGVRNGYDLALDRLVAAGARIPVIASGGAGAPDHVVAVLEAGADAALVAGIVHDGLTTVGAIKSAMDRAGLTVRGSHVA